MNTLLSVSNLSISHGGISAVRSSNIEVKQGEVIALLGPNGAGKSSTLRGIVGLVKSKGNVIFDGEDISGLSTEKIISTGISLVPEGRRLFPNLTVKENLILGAPRKANTKEVYEELLQRLPILKSRSKVSDFLSQRVHRLRSRGNQTSTSRCCLSSVACKSGAIHSREGFCPPTRTRVATAG